jgi:hypothetical protein
MPGTEDRLEERKASYLPAHIAANGGRCLGILCDISRSGGRLQVNRPIEVGAEITVRLASEVERTAVVRRCLPAAARNKFDIGFELMGTYWPEELLE